MYAPQSPFSRKVRIVAEELELSDRLELEYTEVIPGKPNRQFATVNPLRKIPALVLENGHTLFDSTVICQYLQGLSAKAHLFPLGSDQASWQILSEHAIAQGVCDAVILVRYENLVRPESARWQPWLEDQQDKIWSALDWFDANELFQTRALDIAQVTLCCALGYIDFRYPEWNWRKRYRRLPKWLVRLEARQSVFSTRPFEVRSPGTDSRNSGRDEMERSVESAGYST